MRGFGEDVVVVWWSKEAILVEFAELAVERQRTVVGVADVDEESLRRSCKTTSPFLLPEAMNDGELLAQSDTLVTPYLSYNTPHLAAFGCAASQSKTPFPSANAFSERIMPPVTPLEYPLDSHAFAQTKVDMNATCFGFAATNAELLELLSNTHNLDAIVCSEEESYKDTRPSVVAHANRSPVGLNARATGDEDEEECDPPPSDVVFLFGISS